MSRTPTHGSCEHDYQAVINRAHSGIWCGYIGIPSTHPAYGLDLNTPLIGGIDVHGGVTWTGA